MSQYKLFIAYDGTHYGGWQAQINSTAIQTLIEKALKIALKKKIAVVGAGRTDAGVHALEQIAHFSFDEPIDLFRLRASLNGLLPPDIRILNMEPAPPDFHACYSAISKEYHYHLHLERVLDPFKRLYSYHVLQEVDLPLLKQACPNFIGTHDFTSFANNADEGSASRDPVRTLKRLDLIPEKGGIRLEFEANGFLYRMVRNITGTLLDIAAGKIGLEKLPEIFAAKDRQKSGRAAPPHGLFLVKVGYPISSKEA